MNLNYNCVPTHSEALTHNGWKQIENLQVGDELLTLNVTENKFEWNPILQLHFYQNADVKKVFNSSFEVYCTANHRWLTNTLTSKELNQLVSSDILQLLVSADASCLAEFGSKSWKHRRLVSQLSSTKQLSFSSLTVEDYGACDVWCPTTQNQNWLMRQTKTITLTGNSR
jgi:hypothetical protein